MKYTVYLIKNKGQIMYIGVTNNYIRRCREHKYKGSKNSVLPEDTDLTNIEFIPVKEFDNKIDAINFHSELKTNGYNEPKPVQKPIEKPIAIKPISQNKKQKPVMHKFIGRSKPVRKTYSW